MGLEESGNQGRLSASATLAASCFSRTGFDGLGARDALSEVDTLLRALLFTLVPIAYDA